MRMTIKDGDGIAVIDSTEARADDLVIDSTGQTHPFASWLDAGGPYKPWGVCDYGLCPHLATITVADPVPAGACQYRPMCRACARRFPLAPSEHQLL